MHVPFIYLFFRVPLAADCFLSQKHQSKLAITKLSPPSLLTYRKTDHGFIRALLWFLVITPGGWQSLLAVSACFFPEKRKQNKQKTKTKSQQSAEIIGTQWGRPPEGGDWVSHPLESS